MSRRRWLAAALAWGCAGAGRDAGAPADRVSDADSMSDESAEFATADTVLPPMPDVPDRQAGHVVAVGVGGVEFSQAWPARAGRCARPPMVLVIAEEPGQSGVSVLLELPAAGDLTIDYPVSFADSTGMPQAPAAMLGFQFFDQQRGDAYQAAEGVVTLRELSDRRASGQFQVTVRHIATNQRARVAGVFHQVDVDALEPAYCERMQAAQDSLAARPN
jgi:hypothetical protein